MNYFFQGKVKPKKLTAMLETLDNKVDFFRIIIRYDLYTVQSTFIRYYILQQISSVQFILKSILCCLPYSNVFTFQCLGPYRGGSYKSPKGALVNLTQIPFKANLLLLTVFNCKISVLRTKRTCLLRLERYFLNETYFS